MHITIYIAFNYVSLE